MSKKSKAKEKKKKDEKKAKGRNSQRKTKLARFSKAEDEHKRLTAPPKPIEAQSDDRYYEPATPSFYGSDYASRPQDRVSESSGEPKPSIAEELASQGFTRLGGSNRRYDLGDVRGGAGSDYTCGGYVFDEFSFSKDQIPKVAGQMVSPGPGRQFITLEGQRVEVEILDENFVRLPYD